jgi:hypothetical protein
MLFGCPKGSEKPPSVMPQIGAFNHEEHLAEGLGCAGCHTVQPNKQFALLRPGSNAHAPCDGCHEHEKDFYSEPGELCTVCHESVDPLRPGNSPLKPYPQVRNTAQLVAEFDHAHHLSDKVATASIAGLNCQDCHRVPSPQDAYASFPNHAACARCHIGPSAHPHMNQCAGCHQDEGPGRTRKFLRHLQNDVRFTHGKHMVAPTGEKVECRYCHEGIDQSRRVEDLNLPEMRVCSSCHDSELTPSDKRMKNCGLCHTDDVSSQPLPGNHTASAPVLRRRWSLASAKPPVRRASNPRDSRACGDPKPHPGSVIAGNPTFELLELPSLLQIAQTSSASAPPPPPPPAFPKTTGTFSRAKPPKGTSAPQDHTPLFRTNHGRAAEADSSTCNFCHLGVSGSKRDACQDCHAVSRPRSHTLRFRTLGHGRLAARRPKDCATCHEVDYCTECHSVAPQNHFPLQSFRVAHARTARVNSRSCMTCHTFESTCERCHSIDLTVPPRNVSALRRSR